MGAAVTLAPGALRMRPTKTARRFWGAGRIQILRDLVSLGLSSSEIGQRMSATKNAVISKCHREGIQLHLPSGDQKAFRDTRVRLC